MTQLDKIVRDADLPTPSPVLHHLFDMMFDPKCALQDMAEVISTDAGLSARILHAANAAYSSPESRIDNIKDAVVRVGLATLTQILSATEVKALFFSVPGKHGDMHYLWRHNLMTACMADSYARQLGLEKPSRWFTGGLLHDLGRLILLRYSPAKYADVVNRERSGEFTICEAEKACFDTTHEEVGYALMQQWLFPEEIAQAAFHHDQPFTSLENYRTGICIANEITKAVEADEPLPSYDGLLTQQLIVAAGKKYELLKKISGSFT